MVTDQTTSARAPAHSKVRLSRNEVVAAEGVRRAEFETSAAAVNGAKDLVSPASKPRLSGIIEQQRSSLLNVMGIVHCIGMGVASGEKDPPAPEIATAFELLECEIQRIATALEKISLRCAMREIATPARLKIRQARQGHA
jgi:hypothetical protein